ncbi:MAG: TrmB family transcriptional regulator [Candidatus Bathyarchaeia archaeon]
MVISLEEKNLLETLGLTTSQVRVYLALIDNGPSKVSQIAKDSGIHRAHLYQILRSLESNGLVEKNLSDGIFIPTPLKEALEMLIEQKHKEMATIEEKAKTIIGTPKNELKPENIPEISFITNKMQILRKAGSYSGSAKKTLYLMHSWNRFLQLWEYDSANFSNVMASGVIVKQIVDCPEDKLQLRNFLSKPMFSNPLFELRVIPKNNVNFSIIDEEKISISACTEKKLLGEAPMLFSNYKGLVNVLRNYFLVTWESAQKCTDV